MDNYQRSEHTPNQQQQQEYQPQQQEYQPQQQEYQPQQPQYQPQQQYGPQAGPAQQPNYGNAPAKPDSNLVWGILCTCLCCLPLGIVSIVYATKVDSLWLAGAYQEAIEAASKAKKWAIWGAVAGIVFCVLYILLYVVIIGLGVAASGGHYYGY